jgi:hypothetical protein
MLTGSKENVNKTSSEENAEHMKWSHAKSAQKKLFDG